MWNSVCLTPHPQQNPCYVRLEGGRPGEGHVFRPTTLERPAWCDACAHLVFYHATTCHSKDPIFLLLFLLDLVNCLFISCRNE
ncbi:hypothetical protein Pmani_030588 [Petrolisthes manimaculis]|uniref:Uncharacterized protein n=1 Tax=Petrolisthes manimaculis TaxID=1843537 RepID=A0AAE1TVS3_9EUCA|nr:hypothetical protein Pmani_030588 [Petrolisthes manimaculis]